MKSSYKVIHYYSKEDGCFLAFAPELPGCFADGKTLQLALDNLDTVIEEWISVAKEENRDVPVPVGNNYETTNPTIIDVSKYILDKTGAISTMALEKLSYYCLVWSLVWFGQPIFENKFQAWRDGLVCRDLFACHKGKRVVSSNLIESEHVFSVIEKMVMDSVVAIYGKEDGEFLSSLTHQEKPWLLARGNTPQEFGSSSVISNDSIKNAYYYL